MKKYVFILIGVFFLMIDIKMFSAEYPAFEMFRTEAPNTVDMVVNHVIGSRLPIDIVSDVAGYLALIVAAVIVIKEFAGTEFKDDFERQEKKRYKDRFERVLCWSGVGIIAYLFNAFMPFMLNGNLRYRAGYGMFFVCLAVKIAVITMTVTGIMGLEECVEDHDFNNKTTIFALIAVICACVTRICFFYDLGFVYWIYMFLSIAFMLLAIGRFAYILKKRA
ncbi:MAG: hypothetical protein J6U67_06615 [Lachnospiraceae bacterium]|nr:hypothetical protein [Lachnospiraceae bacterium]